MVQTREDPAGLEGFIPTRQRSARLAVVGQRLQAWNRSSFSAVPSIISSRSSFWICAGKIYPPVVDALPIGCVGVRSDGRNLAVRHGRSDA